MHSRAMWRLLAAVAAAAVVVIVLASCQLNSFGTGGNFVGRTYIAVGVTQNGAAKQIVPGTQLTLTFTEDGIAASAGCNSMFSSEAGIEDSVLRVESLGSTEMACDPAVMEQERWWGEFLTSDPGAAVGDRSLTLTTPTTTVDMIAEETVEDLPLTGTAWTLDTLVTGDAASSVPAGGESTLSLTGQSMTITVGTCRSTTLPVTLTQTTIDYDPAALAAGACTGDAVSVDSAVLAVYGDGSVGFRIDGTRLEISGPDGQRLGYSGA